MLYQIEILPAKSEDLEAILGLQKLAFMSEAKFYNDYTIAPLTQTYESISEDFNEYVFLVATLDNRIIGSVKGKDTGEYCWVGRLIVHPDFQNQGIGRQLMKEIEDRFHTSKQFVLMTGDRSDKNIHLYQSLGYQITEKLSDNHNPAIGFVKMVKDNA